MHVVAATNAPCSQGAVEPPGRLWHFEHPANLRHCDFLHIKESRREAPELNKSIQEGLLDYSLSTEHAPLKLRETEKE